MELSLLSDPKCKSSVLCTPVSLLPVAFVINVCIFIFIYKAVPSLAFITFYEKAYFTLNSFEVLSVKDSFLSKTKFGQ